MAGGLRASSERQEQMRAELEELKARLNSDVDALVPRYLPLARPAGRFWELGSPDGAAGQSLKINRSGMKGVWTWYKGSGRDRAGSMLDLIVRSPAYNGDIARAVKDQKGDYDLERVTPEDTLRFAREAAARAVAAQAELDAEEAKKRDRAAALWLGAVPVAGTPAEAYLKLRVPGWRALGAWPGALRYRPDVKFCPVRGSGPQRTGYPAMLAAVFGPDGAIAACHGTFLDIAGWDHAARAGPVRVHKVVRLHDREARPFLLDPARPPDPAAVKGIKSHKATLGRYAHLGGYIPLRKGASAKRLHEVPPGTVVHFSEGIEDALNYAVDHGEAWIGASVSLANMGNVWTPPQAGGLCILADRDPAANEDALAAFEAAVAAQQERRGPQFVSAVWPAPPFKDFSDEAAARWREQGR